MNQKELKELIEFLIEKDIAEFELERGDVKVKIRRGGKHAAAGPVETRVSAVPVTLVGAEVGVTAAAGTPAAPPEAAPVEELHMVKSPIVGTFYEAPSPGAPPFVKPGDTVELGQVLCIVEAMKLMNEIEADAAGEIVERIATSGQPVEYGQPLFAIKAK
jgi:acetyl-CoA carboxylase biotin carboxyl carrier protein